MKNIRPVKCFALLAAAGLIGNLGSANAQSEPPKPEQIVINDSGGDMQSSMRKIFYSEFEKRYGIRVVNTSPVDLGKLKSMVQSSNIDWAVTELAGDDAVVAEKMDLLEPLDHKIIDFSGYPENLRDRKHIFPKSVYSTVITYNTDVYKGDNHPKSWADFFDLQKFPGKRAMQNSPIENLEFALLADGVPADKLYPLDVDRAFKKLDTIKKAVSVWWTTGAQSAQVLVDKEVDMGTVWNGRSWALMKQGAPIAIEWNQGAIKESAFGIPKGAPNAYWGQKFLALASEAKLQGVYADMLGYPGLNLEALKYTDPKVAPFLPTYPEYLNKQFWTNIAWWSDNGAPIKERWVRWVLEK
jgi:putative spermidine/putrescine transport system substrate-binding protein